MAVPTRIMNSADVSPLERQFTGVGERTNFARAIAGLRVDADFLFGTTAVAAAEQVAIRTVDDLIVHFRPLQGEFSAAGAHLGGAGPTTINAEPQNYRNTFVNSPNLAFEATALRIQTVLEAGTYNVSVRGGLLTTSAGGINVNNPGETVTTAVADIGLTANDLDLIEVGQLFNRATNGFAFVANKDKANGTITFEEATSGAATAYKGNWCLNFWKAAFCRIDPTKSVAQGDVTIPLAKALPAFVVPGMIIRGVRRTAGATAGQEPRSALDMRVGTIAADRMSFTIPGGFSIGSGLTLDGATYAGVIILPGLSSTQLCSRKNYGPQLSDIALDGTLRKRTVNAIRIEMTQPVQTWAAPPTGGIYKKADIEAYIAANPTAAFGYWPALWLYGWRPGPNGDGQSTTAAVPWNEVDIYENFGRTGSGGRVWTGNLHNFPFSRKGNVDSISATPLRHRSLKATWLSSSADVKVLTADRQYLQFDAALTDGVKHSYGIVWLENKIVHYVDDLPVCESDWSVETDLPHQLLINLAMGMMTASQAPNMFLPQSDAMAQQNMKIHRIQSWIG